PGRGGAIRRDGLAAALPGRRRGGRPVDCPRGRRPRQLPLVRGAAERAAHRRPGIARHRRPLKGNSHDAREDPGVIDWIIAKRIATFVAGTGDAEAPTADLAALTAESA